MNQDFYKNINHKNTTIEALKWLLNYNYQKRYYTHRKERVKFFINEIRKKQIERKKNKCNIS